MTWNTEKFKKDDPWAMAKLAEIVAREEASIESAKNRQKAALLDYEALRARELHPDRFVVMKKSIDGSHRKWGHQRGKTWDECRDLEVYPPGVHRDANGEFIWTYALESEVFR